MHGRRQARGRKREKSVFDPSNENARQRRRKHDNVTELMRSTVLKECYDVVAYLMDFQEAEPFNDPVDWKGMGLWDYPHIVKNPMDLGTVKELLLDGTLDSHETFADYMRLVFRNSMTYNLEGAPIWHTAQWLLQEFEAMYDEVLQRNRLGPYANQALAAKALAAVFPESEDDDDEIKNLREQILTLQKEFTSMQEEKKLLEFGPTSPVPQSPAPPQTPTSSQTQNSKDIMYQAVRMSRPRRPLTYSEKEVLCADITVLDPSFLPGLLEIIQAAQANSNSDEVEIDIEKLDDKTLIKVANYVQRSLVAQRKAEAEQQQAAMQLEQQHQQEPMQQEHQQQPAEEASKSEPQQLVVNQPHAADVMSSPQPEPEPMQQDTVPPHQDAPVPIKSEIPDHMQVV